jgi:hypothetical protein
LIRIEKYLLTHVLGELAVAEDPDGERGEGSTVGGHQDLQRLVSPAAAYARERGGLAGPIDARSRRLPWGSACALRGQRTTRSIPSAHGPVIADRPTFPFHVSEA